MAGAGGGGGVIATDSAIPRSESLILLALSFPTVIVGDLVSCM